MNQETNPTPPLPGAPARRVSAILWALACCVAAGVAITVAGRFATSAGSYEAGLRNADAPFILDHSEEIGLAAWVAAVGVLVVASLMPRSAVRHFARGALFTCIAAVPLTCVGLHKPAEEQYNDAFCVWVARDVPVDPVRQWAASLPSVTNATTIAAAQWPREIASLSPDTVTELPGSRGVVLEWGRLGTWGTSRRVFVAKDETITPPTKDEFVHFDWQMITPGEYAAFQHRD